MPQGEGTYGSQVGRPSKKRTSFVNDNSWWDKLKQGVSDLRPYNPQELVQNMKQREGKSMLTTKPRKRVPQSDNITSSERREIYEKNPRKWLDLYADKNKREKFN